MAIVEVMHCGPAVISVNDECYKGVTREQGLKILEKAINNTSVVRDTGGYFKLSFPEEKKDETG